MENSGIRRSDRVHLDLAIQISGTDNTGRGFVDAGQTLVLSLHGAKIVVGLKLTPDQEDRKSTRLNSSHIQKSRMPSSA